MGHFHQHFDGNEGNLDYELSGTYFDCLENLFPVWFKGPAGHLRLLSGQGGDIVLMSRTLSASEVLVFPGPCERPQDGGGRHRRPRVVCRAPPVMQ